MHVTGNPFEREGQEMLLNLPIICERLADQIAESSIPEDTELDLSRVQEFSGDEEGLRPECLYVVHGNDVSRFLALARGKISLAIVGPYDRTDLAACLTDVTGWLLLEESLTKSDAMALISSVFEHYRHWRDNIYRSALRRDALGSTLQICAQPFSNPFAVVDMFATVLGVAGTPPSQPDEIWRSVLEEGLSPLDRTSDKELRLVCESEKPVMLDEPPGCSNAIACALRIDGDVVAMIGMTGCESPITPSQASLLEVLRQTLDESRVFEFLTRYSRSRMGAAFSRLLRGDAVEESAVTFALHRWGAEPETTFQILFFYEESGSRSTSGQEATLSHRLDRILPNSIISPYEEGVVAILKRIVTDEDIAALAPLLERYHIRCASSDPFSTFLYLRSSYLQCRAVMTVTKPDDPYGVTRFSEVYEDYVLASLDSSTSLSALCDSRVLALSRSENGAERVRELRVFLAEGRNVALAAKKLYLHRNTLGYRIETLQKTLGIDLHTADEGQVLHLLLSCLIVERIG